MRPEVQPPEEVQGTAGLQRWAVGFLLRCWLPKDRTPTVKAKTDKPKNKNLTNPTKHKSQLSRALSVP